MLIMLRAFGHESMQEIKLQRSYDTDPTLTKCTQAGLEALQKEAADIQRYHVGGANFDFGPGNLFLTLAGRWAGNAINDQKFYLITCYGAVLLHEGVQAACRGHKGSWKKSKLKSSISSTAHTHSMRICSTPPAKPHLPFSSPTPSLQNKQPLTPTAHHSTQVHQGARQPLGVRSVLLRQSHSDGAQRAQEQGQPG